MKPSAKIISNLRETGFSVIELIIVILVVGILAMVALPKITSTTRISAIVAADLAAMEIRAAQSRAMYSSSPQTITFSGNSYTTGGVSRALPGRATATAYSLTFTSFGEPSSPNGKSFKISDGNTSRTIHISSLTGKVTIQ